MKSTIIIAEAGVNHNGNISQAKNLINKAVEAGADYIKFQSFKADKLVSPNAQKADYQVQNMDSDNNQEQYQMLKQLELSEKAHEELIHYCQKNNIKFLSTAFDNYGLFYLDSLGLDTFKSPSGEINNYPYLRTLAKIRKPVILSTGMANLQEIKEALNILTSEGLSKDQITVLHCNTEYPTPMEDVNLKAMLTIQKELGVKVGYSDHTLGIEVPIAAVTLGATVIEKHFTLDRNLPGPDHRASLEPDELKAMVKAIRNVEKVMSGDGVKRPSNSEVKNLPIVRKSIHTKVPIQKGEILSEENLIPLRPGDGISPMHWQEIIGRKTLRDLEAYHQLSWDEVE